MLTSSQKHDIESLIKSNKIVVIERDHENHKIRLFDESTTTQSEAFGLGRRRERDSSSGSAPPCSCANTTDFDLMHLFELYGIDMSNVTRVSLRENVAQGDRDDNDDDLIVRCEEFILQRYLEANMTLLKYPMVFIHGLYFGSTEELNLAHVEGFLFEMFKDSGLYPTTANSDQRKITRSNVSDHSDYDHDDESGTDETESYEKFTIDDDDEANDRVVEVKDADECEDNETESPRFNMDLSAVAQANQLLSALSGSRRSRLVSVSIPVSLVRSMKTSQCLDSELSTSLSSVNRQKMCESFVRKAQTQHQQEQQLKETRFKKLPSSASALADVSKEVIVKSAKSTMRTAASRYSKTTCARNCCTPPRDVLAKINQWMQMTREMIERRNRELANKRLSTPR